MFSVPCCGLWLISERVSVPWGVRSDMHPCPAWTSNAAFMFAPMIAWLPSMTHMAGACASADPAHSNATGSTTIEIDFVMTVSPLDKPLQLIEAFPLHGIFFLDGVASISRSNTRHVASQDRGPRLIAR